MLNISDTLLAVMEQNHCDAMTALLILSDCEEEQDVCLLQSEPRE